MDDAESTIRAGYKLDRYELLCPIASGGMASVWLAQLRGKRGFEKLFAIKTIKSELTSDSRFTEMFLDEARIASGIQHSNVAQILDLGEQDDVLYIVMEWVDGDSLARLKKLAVKQGTPLPLGIALRIMADACAGLHAAHELRDGDGSLLGVVHRDVSPQNILVATSGDVKVIDFGVVKAKNRGAGETKSGVVKGKLRYMAPEQVQGHAIDRRADLWAIGVCLHELVTGQLPYDGESDVEIIRRLMTDEPPARAKGSIPESVEQILAHSLVRDPEERFATGAAMQRALEVAIDELGLSTTNEDVADYLRANLRELETKRRETVAKALAAAKARGPSAGTATTEVSAAAKVVSDAAFAATVVSEREPNRLSQKPTVVHTKKKTQQTGSKKLDTSTKKKRSQTKAEARADRGEESKLTPAAATFTERAKPPAKRWRGLAVGGAIAAALAITWVAWPRGTKLPAVGIDTPPEPTSLVAAPQPSPAITATATTPAVTIPVAPPIAPSAAPVVSAVDAGKSPPDGGKKPAARGGRNAPASSPTAEEPSAPLPFPQPPNPDLPEDTNPY